MAHTRQCPGLAAHCTLFDSVLLWLCIISTRLLCRLSLCRQQGLCQLLLVIAAIWFVEDEHKVTWQSQYFLGVFSVDGMRLSIANTCTPCPVHRGLQTRCHESCKCTLGAYIRTFSSKLCCDMQLQLHAERYLILLCSEETARLPLIADIAASALLSA